jgi:hypothetical protein
VPVLLSMPVVFADGPACQASVIDGDTLEIRGKRAMARPAAALDQAVAIDNRMDASACKRAKSVTHVSGTKCHLCLGPLIITQFAVCPGIAIAA